MSDRKCPVCGGRRLRPEVLAVTVGEMNIMDVCDLSIKDSYQFFQDLELTERQLFIGKEILKEIKARLKFLVDVGLDYITMSRSSGTLSGGEAQRVKLATELSKRSTGNTIYILDEPTTGLHRKDIDVLLVALNRLISKGHTVIIIEHNPAIILAADHVIDLGPEGGKDGGQIVCTGTPEQIAKCEESYTGKYIAQIINRHERQESI